MKTELCDKKLFLLDMDGTLYLGDRLFADTPQFLKKIREMGGRYFFLTNNSSKSVSAYIEKLARMGIGSTKEDFVTSVDCTSEYLCEKYGERLIYALGTESFRTQLRCAGLNITDKLTDGICALVMGFDTELSFSKLEDACRLLGRGVDYIATNPDLVCPTEFGYVPDCGSVAIMLENATGRKPLYIGKPQSAMAEYAIKRAGCTPEQTVLVGDRVYTDILCGVNCGIDTVMVLSGEGTEEQTREMGILPTYILGGIGDICHML